MEPVDICVVGLGGKYPKYLHCPYSQELGFNSHRRVLCVRARGVGQGARDCRVPVSCLVKAIAASRLAQAFRLRSNLNILSGR
jgi:hypothetical protein